jgi:cell cycle checkpoint protein
VAQSNNEEEEEDEESDHSGQTFEISLFALLETLQIFSVTDTSGNRFSKQDAYSALSSTAGAAAFSSTVLGVHGLCRLSYATIGSPLEVIMEEASVRTTCELTTYEPESFLEDIPFMRSDLQMKIILRSAVLHDALGELASTRPERVLFAASDNVKSFEMSAEGPHGSANVEFNNLDNSKLLDTFVVSKSGVTIYYNFGLLYHASRAMAVATKVSLRIDKQGVLSLQFMIEVEGGGVSFVDFRFVPLIRDNTEDTDTDGDTDADNEQE